VEAEVGGFGCGPASEGKSEQRDAQAGEGEVDECGWTMEAMGTFGWEAG
jgi:hypothetical protein